MHKVCVFGGDWQIESMFTKRGWKVVPYLGGDYDLLMFTGGEDVDPSFYGEEKHPATYSNPDRDSRESHVYHQDVGRVPLAGICRGGQFLNVMNGGKMWQHVNNHGIAGTHSALDVLSGNEYQVTSTHHQMMIPADKDSTLVLLTAKVSTNKQSATQSITGFRERDVEAIFYADTNSLCFQPHPEYTHSNHECQELFFNYLKTFFNL